LNFPLKKAVQLASLPSSIEVLRERSLFTSCLRLHGPRGRNQRCLDSALLPPHRPSDRRARISALDRSQDVKETALRDAEQTHDTRYITPPPFCCCWPLHLSPIPKASLTWSFAAPPSGVELESENEKGAAVRGEEARTRYVYLLAIRVLRSSREIALLPALPEFHMVFLAPL
jgi:hypothetical protein